jgi:hypothetical protein
VPRQGQRRVTSSQTVPEQWRCSLGLEVGCHIAMGRIEEITTLNRRSALLAALALPAGCAIQPLPPLSGRAIPAPDGPTGSLRAPLVGQWWTYRKLNFFNSSVLDVVQEVVTSVVPTIDVNRQPRNAAALADEKHAAWGQLSRDSAWDYPMTFETPVPLWPASLAVGAKSSSQTRYRMDGGSIRYWIQVSTVASGWDRVTVSAGTFDTLRIERLIRLEHQDHGRSETVRRDTMWLALEVGRWVARETSGRYFLRGDNRFWEPYSLEDHVRWELTAWH